MSGSDSRALEGVSGRQLLFQDLRQTSKAPALSLPAPLPSSVLLGHLISGVEYQSEMQIYGNESGSLIKRTPKNYCLTS